MARAEVSDTFANRWIASPVLATASVALPTPIACTSFGATRTPTILASIEDAAA